MDMMNLLRKLELFLLNPQAGEEHRAALLDEVRKAPGRRP